MVFGHKKSPDREIRAFSNMVPRRGLEPPRPEERT